MDSGGSAGEDVSEFLQRIKELGDKRDREDAERARKLEADILAGRQARRARRDERARSISPQKDSPLSPMLSRPATGDGEESPTKSDSAGTTLERLTGKLADVTLTPTPAPTPAPTPTGAPTSSPDAPLNLAAATSTAETTTPNRPALSWQSRRPKSVVGPGTLRRELSAQTQQAVEPEGGEIDRAQIASNLSAKDPEWFRQAAERNATSGALRKPGEERMEHMGKMGLPGMSSGEPQRGREATPEPETPMRAIVDRSKIREEPTRNISTASTASTATTATASSTASFHSRTRAKSLHNTSSDLFKMPMSPSQEKLSAEPRSVSPTKGLGGFVQSAMLKREGSVSKRWSNSQQQSGSLSRASSTATVRPNYPRGGSVSESTHSRESSPAPDDGRSERPGSRDMTDAANRARAPSTSEAAISQYADRFARNKDSTPPASPSRTYEQKRWSPTKSSWLETALKKSTDNPLGPAPTMKPLGAPEATRRLDTSIRLDPTPPSRPQTNPKPSIFSSKPPERRTDARVGDLPAPQPKTPVEKPGVVPPKSATNTSSTPSPKASQEKPPATTPQPSVSALVEGRKEETQKAEEKSSETPPKPEKPASLSKVITSASPSIPRSTSPDKLESPTKSTNDPLGLRAGLKPRPAVDRGGDRKEPEFLGAISRLRSAKTQNYKAPNELKERILQGKANLTITGGPQKNKRSDEFKESILSAKGSLKHSSDASLPSLPKTAPKPKPDIPQRHPNMAVEKKSATPEDVPEVIRQTSIPARIATKKSMGSLADRFNPNLANLLQRGPPAASTTSSRKTLAGESRALTSNSGSSESAPSGQLNHMTKNRARGPKRRAPTKAAGAAVKNDNTSPKNGNTEPASDVAVAHDSRATSTPKKSATLVGVPLAGVKSPETPRKSDNTKPPTPAKSPLLRGTSSSNLKENVKPSEQKSATPPSLRKPSSQALEANGSSPRDKSTGRSSLLSGRFGATVEDEVDASPPVSPESLRRPSSGSSAKPLPSRPLPSPQPVQPRPLPAPPVRAPSPSPIPATPSSQVLSEFFKGPDLQALKIDFDLVGIISASPAGFNKGKLNTLKLEVSEVTGHGKMSSAPSGREHIFYEEGMYICIHRFELAPGQQQQVDVYLWSGGKVSEGSVDDAQLFARKVARENDAKLTQHRQGRETPAFLVAIGGILITLRGAPRHAPPRGPFMLCGRSLSGGMVFDEVDMQVSSLCSGYTYVLADDENNVSLWKGKGATLSEIGAARLVGFELSGREMREFGEADEPDAFFDALGGYQERVSADYWHLRPSCKKYATRLFKVDLQLESKVVEISPFCQADLDPREIYIADAFFEFYIMLGSQSQSKREEFQIALQFTEEYSILAVSLEDRPFIPVSSIILGGAPREFRALFRSWEEDKTPTTWQPTRKPSMRIVSLAEAKEVIGI